MSAQVNPIFLEQFAGGDKGETTGTSGNTGANMTLIAPGAAPYSAVPTGISLGNYVLQQNSTASQSSCLSQLIDPSGTTQFGNSSYVCLGFWWCPGVNPSIANATILGIDDGSINGVAIGWKTTKALAIMDYAGTVLGTHTAAPDIAEVYHGVTNPWYYLQLAVNITGTGAANYAILRVYKWNNATGNADPSLNLDKIGADLVVTNFGCTTKINFRYGDVTNAPTVKWCLGNIYLTNGSPGLFGPVGPSMVTIWPTGKLNDGAGWRKGDLSTATTTGTANAAVTFDATHMTDTRAAWTVNAFTGFTCTSNAKKGYITSNTATVLTVSSWVGGTPANGSSWSITSNDPRTGATDTEYPYISEVPFNDATTSYLRATGGSQQDYNMTQNAIPTTGTPTNKNILAWCARFRIYDQSGGSHHTLGLEIQYNNGAAGTAENRLVGPTFDVWLTKQFICSSFRPDAGFVSGPYAPLAAGNADVNLLQPGHLIASAAATISAISQLWITVAYGTDEALLAAVTGGESEII